MAKYTPLTEYLHRCTGAITMGFDHIGALVGGLPTSAFENQAWWANRDEPHAQSRAWRSADC